MLAVARNRPAAASDPMAHEDSCLFLPSGALLFQEGDAGAAAYLIEAGQVEIFLRRDGRDRTLALRGTGEIVGEMAIIDGRPRSASARAAQDCTLVPVTSEQLTQRSMAADPILRMVLGVAIDRCRQTLAALGPTQVAFASGAAPSFETWVPGPVSDAAIGTLRLEREIRRALRQREFVLFFQPIVHLRSRRLAGFEALVRWRHPERGLVPPGAFIPAAEAGGLIVELTAWCLAEVGRVLPDILAAASANPGAVEGPFVSVNVSGHDLAQAGFSDSLQSLLRATGVAPSALKIEVTESTLMQEPKRACMALGACRALGMGIAIDDFGTGYSSLSYLSTLPVTTLKVDRSFVQPMARNPTSRRIVGTILRLADELGISAVAEGIEHEAEAAALAAMGCEYGQGYLFGRPAPLRATIDLIGGWSARPPLRAALARAAPLVLDPA
jgi:EAL domain-containing protein (putative c-di-GMP-specific phosphodiesterase class I)